MSSTFLTRNLSENAKTVLEGRYLLRDPETKLPIETIEGMFMRVASFVAEAEVEKERKLYTDRFFDMMTNLEFLPNTPCLVNAGKRQKDSGLSACFVLPIADDLDAIYSTLKDAAIILKSGGGVGYAFSHLRPRGDRVGSTGGVAGGPVTFMKLFHTSAQQVMQGGVRPGAQMAILSVDHPDIEEFITCKEKDKSLSTFNISVAITNKFMRAVENGDDHYLVNPRTQVVVKQVKATEIWKLITEYAHKTGDPGLFFVDEANKYNPTPKFGNYESTNPCGEVVLLPGEPCNLGSIVVSRFIDKDDSSGINWEKLGQTVHTAIRFLDNIITMNAYPVPLVKEMAEGNRKIGLGIMGWADLLVKLEIPYGSVASLYLADQLMSYIKKEAYKASQELAEERGCFPNWSESELAKQTETWGPARKQRNSTKLTIAPTGSISVIAGCSSGIEPHFALAYKRKALQGEKVLYYFNDDLKRELEGIFDVGEMEDIAKNLSEVGTLGKLDSRWIEKISYKKPELFGIFKSSYDVTTGEHIQTLATFQQHVDSSISKTINLPKEATVEDIAMVYHEAWVLKCKGVTVYRDGCRSDQPLSIGEDKKAEATAPLIMGKIGPRKRSHALRGSTRFINTGCGELLLTVNYDEEGIAEVVAKGGKSGGCISAQLEAIGRLTSLALRSGVSKEKIISQLSGISCHLPAFYTGPSGDARTVKSCGDAISIGMVEAIAEMEDEIILTAKKEPSHQGGCPLCGGPVKHESGCTSCVNPGCAWSRC